MDEIHFHRNAPLRIGFCWAFFTVFYYNGCMWLMQTPDLTNQHPELPSRPSSAKKKLGRFAVLVSACLLGFSSHRRWTFTPTSERTFYFRSVAVDHFYLQLLAIHTRIPPCWLCAGRIDRAASAPGSRRSHTAHRFAVSKRQNCSSLKIKLTDRYD